MVILRAYMPISTLYTLGSEPVKPKKSANFSVLTYILGIISVGLLVFFGGEIIKNFDKLGGKSALTVDTLNGSAQVFLNGQQIGTTPLEYKKVKPGDNKITIKNETRQYETSINFLSNSDQNVYNVGLFRDLGISDVFSSGQEFWFEKDKSGNLLRVVSEPSGASVSIDGTEIGKTPFSSNTLSEDSYDLKIEHAGFESQTARINIKKSFTLNVNVKLFPMPVPSKVDLLPGAASLYNIPSDNDYISADTQNWVKGIIYWNKTRGVNLSGAGENKEQVFDYFIDFKGNLYDKDGTQVMLNELDKLGSIKKGAYLARATDPAGLTPEAKATYLKLSESAKIPGKTATIKETGVGWLRVRETPGISGKEIGKVDVGKTFEVFEEKPGWIKIKASETISGWVSADYVTLSK
jgi:hypothetical protein